MMLTRRSMLVTCALAALSLAIMPRAQAADAAPPAPAADPRMGDRAIGSPDAKIVVQEWFSFTCPHCAHFAADVLPEIQAKLVDTGKLRIVFHAYPRDQVDLMAAMVARSLPAERYVPFMETLLASQARWAFDRSVEPKDELAKMAALAGMSRAMFDRVVADEQLKSEILAAQAQVENAYHVDSTPTFIVANRALTGEAGLSYEAFAKAIGAS